MRCSPCALDGHMPYVLRLGQRWHTDTYGSPTLQRPTADLSLLSRRVRRLHQGTVTRLGIHGDALRQQQLGRGFDAAGGCLEAGLALPLVKLGYLSYFCHLTEDFIVSPKCIL